MNDIEEKLLLSGTWLYDGTVESEVHIIKTNFKAGSGDYEDEPKVRDDQFGIFYGIVVGQYTETERSLGAGCKSVEEAKRYASKVCPSLKWNTSDVST